MRNYCDEPYQVKPKHKPNHVQSKAQMETNHETAYCPTTSSPLNTYEQNLTCTRAGPFLFQDLTNQISSQNAQHSPVRHTHIPCKIWRFEGHDRKSRQSFHSLVELKREIFLLKVLIPSSYKTETRSFIVEVLQPD